ncbi:DUF106 domain-containing protein [Candidatus Woesearchaeota archaeon]|nr:DUF106 domain-containing protein [Candidatus Woesearchaeota archaeon]
MAFFTSFFDTTFGFLLNWNPIYAITVISFIISLLIVIIYKYMTNQKEMKELKEKQKEYQKKMKETKDTEKLMKIQKEAMALNMKYMGKSMKPTLITFIPILLIFGWMNAHFAYMPLMPGQEFNITAQMEKGITGSITINVPEGLEIIGENTKEITEREATFTLKGKEGEYYTTLASNNEEVDKQILITTEPKYAPVTESYKSDVFKTVKLENKPLKVWWKLGWIWVYIITAIVFSMLLRKLMKVY